MSLMPRGLIRLLAGLLATVCLSSEAFAQSKPVTLAIQPSADMPQLLLAADRKLWESAKLQVNVVTFSTGREALEALLGGQADFAVLTEYPALIGILRGQKFSVLADISRYRGFRVTASGKWTNLASLKDLDGKKVGTTLGTNVEYLTSLMLREGGAKAEIVNAAPADTVPALVRGDIQAAVMFPSLYAQARRLLGPDYREIRTTSYTSHSVLVGAGSVLADRKAEVEAFLRGALAADKIVATDPKAGQAVVLTALKGVMTPEVLAEQWSEYDYGFQLKDDLVSIMAQEANWIAERGLVKVSAEATGSKTLRRAIDDAFLAHLAPSSVALTTAP